MKSLGRTRAALVCVVTAFLALPSCEACEACDRSTRAGSREPTGDMVFVNQYGGIMLVARDKIPKDQQRHCDVCPELCTQVDLRPLPIGMVIATYREAISIYTAMDGPRSADAVILLERMACIVAAGDPSLKKHFLQLLDDSDLQTRFVAAVHALHYHLDVPTARGVLEAVAARADDSGKPTSLAYSAKFLLMEHEKGNDLVLP